MSLCDYLSEDQIAGLYTQLAAAGFEPPIEEWLEVRIQEIHFELERIRWQRNTHEVKSAVENWVEAKRSIAFALRLVEHWEDALTAPRVRDDVDLEPGNAWNYDRAEPISDEDFAAIMTAPEFSDAEIETCRRVLRSVRALTKGVHDHHARTFETRPQRKEKPEIWAVLGGFMRIWCQATKIDQVILPLSLSESNAALNFIEQGANMLFDNPMDRETIFKRLIEHRDRLKRGQVCPG